MRDDETNERLVATRNLTLEELETVWVLGSTFGVPVWFYCSSVDQVAAAPRPDHLTLTAMTSSCLLEYQIT